MQVSRRLLGCGGEVVDGVEGDDVRADRRDRCGGDHFPAGRARRATQLGLSVLLAPRYGVHAAGAAARGIRRRGTGLEEVAAARRRWRSRPGAGDLRDWRRARVDRVGAEMAAGVWEVRGGPKHFTHSKVMAWVAVDRGIEFLQARMNEEHDGSLKRRLKQNLDRWKKVRDEIHRDVCKKGFDKELNSFVQYYGAKTLDASCLRIALVGF